MQVSARTLSAIGRIITGDEKLSPYRSGPQLVRLFNDYGADDSYSQGFPSRWQYAENRLRDLNGTPAMAAILREVLDPREFFDTEFDLTAAVDYVNKRLRYDGFEVVIDKEVAKICDLKGTAVEVPASI